MNTLINQKAERFEKLKRFLFNFQLTVVCLMLPVLFIVGIQGNGPKSKTPIYKESSFQLNPNEALVDFHSPLPDK